MAREYCMLPSQIIQQATTYDYMVLDITATYDAWVQNPNNVGDALSEADMIAALEKAKAQHGK